MSNATDRRGRFRLRLPTLSGGLDLAAEPDAIDDCRLSDGTNLWWERGALRTRPGLFCTQEHCETLHEAPTDTEDTYTFVKAAPLDVPVTAGGAPAEVVTEQWQENGITRIRPLRVGRDGLAYPYRDEDGGPMKPFAFDHCLVTNDETGNPLFFTPDGVFCIGGESIDGEWMSVEDWLYAPLLRIGGSGSFMPQDSTVTGTAFEAPNLLTPRFRAQYTTDGSGIYYFLPRQNLADEPVTASYLDNFGNYHSYTIEYDQTQSEADFGYRFHVNRAGGYVWFTNTAGDPVAVLASGHGGNLTVEASVRGGSGRRKILGMRFGTWFGGDNSGIGSGTRLFVSGNPEYPHLVHWSDVNNALYFPENNYAYIGDATQRVTALKKQEDALIIFKERELYAATYESTPISAAELTAGSVSDVTAQSAAFPLTPLSAGVGCDCPATIRLCHDRLVWANQNGSVHMLLAKSAYSGRNIRTLSAVIAPPLQRLSDAQRANMSAAACDGWYLLLTGNTIWALRYDSPAFVRYAGVAADRDAQEQLAWFKLDVTLAGVDWQFVTGREGMAVLYGLRRKNGALTRLLYTLSGDTDCVPQETGFAAAPIAFSAATKRLDVGDTGRRKDITGVWLDLHASAAAQLRVVLSDDDSGRWESPPLYARSGCRLIAGLRRARRVRVTLHGQGDVALAALELSGNTVGEVK